MPDNYAPPTPEHCIEIKTYPKVRRADYDDSKLTAKGLFGESRTFFTLFSHIKSNKIPMTAPVELEYQGVQKQTGFFGGEKFVAEGQKMGFLYRTPDFGPVGETPDGVVVEDKPEVTVISIGVSSGRNSSTKHYSNGVDILKALLATQKAWVQAGEPRELGYNSPSRKAKWLEVQIPIKLA